MSNKNHSIPNRLVIISAPSGGGKTTMCKKLLQDFSDRLELSISTTTRQPRGDEKEGREYFFIAPEIFMAKIDKNDFAEWAIVHGNYYGTSKSTLEDFRKRNKAVLLDIDVQGAESLKKSYPGQSLSIFIAPPDMTALEARLRGRRTESEEKIRTRINNARLEMEKAKEFDCRIINDDLERSYAELKGIVSAYLDGRTK